MSTRKLDDVARHLSSAAQVQRQLDDAHKSMQGHAHKLHDIFSLVLQSVSSLRDQLGKITANGHTPAGDAARRDAVDEIRKLQERLDAMQAVYERNSSRLARESHQLTKARAQLKTTDNSSSVLVDRCKRLEGEVQKLKQQLKYVDSDSV